MDDLRSFLQTCTTNELTGLAAILGTKEQSVDTIIDGFWWNCQNTAYYYLGYRPSYLEILQTIAALFQISYTPEEVPTQLEITIARATLQLIWEQMTPAQRQAMEEQLRVTAQAFDKTGSVVKGGSLFLTLTAAQLSGFGVYLLASTTIGAITGTLGLTLPFAVYTSMSSVIATIIGPVGWIGAGLFTLWTLNGANYTRLVPAVMYVCMLRARRTLGDDDEIAMMR